MNVHHHLCRQLFFPAVIETYTAHQPASRQCCSNWRFYGRETLNNLCFYSYLLYLYCLFTLVRKRKETVILWGWKLQLLQFTFHHCPKMQHIFYVELDVPRIYAGNVMQSFFGVLHSRSWWFCCSLLIPLCCPAQSRTDSNSSMRSKRPVLSSNLHHIQNSSDLKPSCCV